MGRGRKVAVLAAVMVCAGAITSVALATHSQFTSTGVVPLFCGADNGFGGHASVYRISPSTELKVRIGWAVKSQDQATLFLAHQKLVWTITRELDGAPIASHVPAPEYGDTANWSGPVYQEIVDGNGKLQKIWLSSYLAPTSLYVPDGETWRISYSLTADRKTDDGFGTKKNAYEVLSGGNTCTVTGSTS
jgi:hypothetical protein